MIAALMLSALLALVPASADDNSYIYDVKYDELEWKAYEVNNYKEVGDYNNIIDLTCTDKLLSAQVKTAVDERSLIATKTFPITEETNYVYYVNAKNNRVGGYTGVIYAVDAAGKAYILYGAHGNGGDDDTSKCLLRAAKNDFANELFGARKEYAVKQDLTADGFGQYKIVYTGYKVQVFTLSDGEWKLANFGGSNDTITLSAGSQLAIGIYNRESGKDNQRTCAITGSRIESSNPEIVKELLNRSLGEAIVEASELVPAAYTAESYKAVADAVDAANALSADASFDDIEACINAIKDAIAALVPAKYTVKFDANGGTGAMDPIADINGGAYVIPECTFTAPEGKLFKGWATAADGEVIDGEATLVKDTTFYAIWDFVTYTVSFNRNGGSGKMFDAEGIVGEYTLPEPTYAAPEGKVFKGWATTENGEVVGATYNVTADTTFYAIWGDPSYSVTFDANGGSGEMAAAEASGEYTLPECGFTAPEGKKFKGWATTKDGAKLVDKVEVSGDITVFAIWEDKPVEETDAPTDKTTEAPADSNKPTEKPAEQNGCGSSIAIGATVVVALIGTAVVFKKKD
jgi:hypothetical protein